LHSWQRALQCGVRPDRLLHAVDPAFSLAPAPKMQVESMLRALQLAPGAFVSLNLRAGSPERVEPLLHSLALFLPEVVRKLGLQHLLLFGMQRFRENHDGEILARLRELLRGRLSAVIWLPEENPALLKGILERSRAVLSCRYHGAVFGLSTAVPTIGIVLSREYDIKLRGLFHHYGLDRFCLQAEQFQCGAASWLEEIRDRDSEIRDHLRAVNERLVSELERPYERIRELINWN